MNVISYDGEEISASMDFEIEKIEEGPVNEIGNNYKITPHVKDNLAPKSTK